jgi:hypothetical protein
MYPDLINFVYLGVEVKLAPLGTLRFLDLLYPYDIEEVRKW